MITLAKTIKTHNEIRENIGKDNVSTVFFKVYFATMVQVLSLEEWNEFILSVPLEYGKHKISSRDLVRYLLNDKNQVPINYYGQFLDKLELYFLERSKDFNRFYDMLKKYNRGINFTHGWIVNFVLAHFESLLKVVDFRPRILSMTKYIVKKSCPGFRGEYVGHSTKGNIHSGWIIIFPQNNEDYNKINWGLWHGYSFVNPPLVFGLPPYEKMKYHGDPKSVRDILEPAIKKGAVNSVVLDNARFFIDGKLLGQEMRFYEAFPNLIPYFSKFNLEDRKGIFIEKDYFSSYHNRVVLKAGCFYGAPCPAFFFEYASTKAPNYNELKSSIEFVDKIRDEDIDFKINTFIENLPPETPHSVKYVRSLEKIFFNGELITRGVPAKILHYCLGCFFKTGQTQFTNQEILTEVLSELLDKNHNLERRLDLLKSALQRSPVGIGLQKAGRGLFELSVPSAMSLISE